MERISVRALKGHNKSAQGITLGSHDIALGSRIQTIAHSKPLAETVVSNFAAI
jgi:hypothetical protein